jgi:hypothetical protein
MSIIVAKHEDAALVERGVSFIVDCGGRLDFGVPVRTTRTSVTNEGIGRVEFSAAARPTETAAHIAATALCTTGALRTRAVSTARTTGASSAAAISLATVATGTTRSVCLFGVLARVTAADARFQTDVRRRRTGYRSPDATPIKARGIRCAAVPVIADRPVRLQRRRADAG